MFSGGYVGLVALVLLVAVRVAWTLHLPISDCDEVHNYWEPSHLLAYGHGKQTWEYHPRFALRSWLFNWLYAWPAYVMANKNAIVVAGLQTLQSFEMISASSLASAKDHIHWAAIGGTGVSFPSRLAFAHVDKPVVFYACKMLASLVACFADWYLLRGVNLRFGRLVSRTLYIVLLFATGVTQAAGSFLPSSFAMICFTVALGAWVRITSQADARVQLFLMTAHSARLKKDDKADGSADAGPRRTVVPSQNAGPAAPRTSTLSRTGAAPSSTSSPKEDRKSTRAGTTASTAEDAESNKVEDRRRTQMLHDKFFSTRAVLASSGPELVVGLTAVSLAGIVGWPFSLLVALPMALSVLTCVGLLLPAVLFVFISGALSMCVAAVDTYYYGRPVFSTLNLVRYNVFGEEGRGSHLYGVEPWHFFFTNLTLNFNVAFFFALASPAALVLLRKPVAAVLGFDTLRHGMVHVSPFFLWFVFWLRVPHKEDRFMAPAYPFLCLAAALAVSALVALFPVPTPAPPEDGTDANARQRHRAHQAATAWQRVAMFTIVTSLWVFCVVSLGRTTALWQFYHAPEASALALHDYILRHAPPPAGDETLGGRATLAMTPSQKLAAKRRREAPIIVCFGKEWYRFPGSFFLPQQTAGGRLVRFAFLPTSGFHGALPKDFELPRLQGGSKSTQDASAAELADDVRAMSSSTSGSFNDLNREELDQYVTHGDRASADVCDFYVDSTLGAPDPLRQEDRQAAEHGGGSVWSLVRPLSFPILDKDRTPFWCRLLFVPSMTKTCAVWGTVFTLKNEQKGW